MPGPSSYQATVSGSVGADIAPSSSCPTGTMGASMPIEGIASLIGGTPHGPVATGSGWKTGAGADTVSAPVLVMSTSSPTPAGKSGAGASPGGIVRDADDDGVAVGAGAGEDGDESCDESDSWAKPGANDARPSRSPHAAPRLREIA